MSGWSLGCSFRREISAPCCSLGPSQRSCSAEPFYTPATIYAPNEVLINCHLRGPARRRPGKPSTPALGAAAEGGVAAQPVSVWGLSALRRSCLCAWSPDSRGARTLHSSRDSATLGAGLLVFPSSESAVSHCCSQGQCSMISRTLAWSRAVGLMYLSLAA